MIPVFHEALAAHMLLMAMGVPAEQIYVAANVMSPDGKRGQLGVIAEWDGIEFTITVGDAPDMDEATFTREWSAAVATVRAMTDEQAREFRDTSRIRERAVEIAAAYTEKRLKHLKAWQ